MRWKREPSLDERKRDLARRREAIERDLAAAEEAGDQLERARALNNLGAVHADLEEWEEALERYEQAVAATPDDAPLDDRATPHGNAANAARRLQRWPEAVAHAAWVDALGGAEPDETQQTIANAALGLVRKAVGPDELGKLLDEAVAALPAELRDHVRREAHLHPTAVAPERPGRNDPCWCGSGKKYKHCHMKEDRAAAD